MRVEPGPGPWMQRPTASREEPTRRAANEESARGDLELMANQTSLYPCLSPRRVPLERPLGNLSSVGDLVLPLQHRHRGGCPLCRDQILQSVCRGPSIEGVAGSRGTDSAEGSN